ncbi:MAG: hypothetical protein LBV55_00690 [Acholeplasmatales bacterium]|jgi:hypothetical protein|nr:hypothetical protein [Acholeplasmatales bacterium]
MAVTIAIKCHEGIVLAADTRISLEVKNNNQSFFKNFDSTKKLLNLGGEHSHIGILNSGVFSIKKKLIASYLPELIHEIGEEALPNVFAYAQAVYNFFQNQWDKEIPIDYNGPELSFVVAGFDRGDFDAKLYTFNIPFHNTIKEVFEGNMTCGIHYGGDSWIINRLIRGFDQRVLEDNNSLRDLPKELRQKLIKEIEVKSTIQFPFDIYSLEDAIKLANTLISTSIDIGELSLTPSGNGGQIIVAVIKYDEDMDFVQGDLI